ncbi:MAG: lipase maturation factor family protein [Mycobacterium sp.]
MDWLTAQQWWWGRLILERGVAAVYVVAFVCAARQFRGLIGERGMLPVPKYLAHRSFRATPSVFHVHYSDRFFGTLAWAGAVVSAAMVAGLADVVPLWAAILLWLLLWVCYLSIVNVGQIWYSFGWESLLLETGLLVSFVGNNDVAPPVLVMWLIRWLLFRVEFGAGLIKLRGDRCWRDLTCLDYHHETQPMPGPLSWFFHHLPRPFHRIEVAGNHVAQLVVPFGLFAPAPVASVCAAIIAITQLWLVLSGNFSWLNWLTIVLALSVLDTSTLAAVFGTTPPVDLPATQPHWYAALVIAFTTLVVVRSWYPLRNLVSRRQRMNSTFDSLHMVNTYGAFGSINRTREEVVLEGTSQSDPTDDGWTEYEFRGKPGDVRRMPRQWSPYHLRLDWLMWFLPISPAYAQTWLVPLCRGLLTNEPSITGLLRTNPFRDAPPMHVRATLYRYRFSSARELRSQRVWWHRERVGEYLAPLSLAEADYLSRRFRLG